jgi:hypothetical protein
MDLLAEVQKARGELPKRHRALLDQLNVQEVVVHDWPDGIANLYRTLGERPPSASRLKDAAAVWLQGHRTAAFNGPLLQAMAAEVDVASARAVIQYIAWHEYGHALSLTLATDELRAEGPALLELLPERFQELVGADSYARSQVFDEIVATVYTVMINRIRTDGYGAPDFIHPHVFAAFQEVIPWPPIH